MNEHSQFLTDIKLQLAAVSNSYSDRSMLRKAVQPDCSVESKGCVKEMKSLDFISSSSLEKEFEKDYESSKFNI